MRDDERQSAPAAGQWYEEYGGHLLPCPWHHHRHKDNPLEKSDSTDMMPAHKKIDAINNLSSDI